MNWRINVGILIILCGVKEIFAATNDYRRGVTTMNPIFAQLGCGALIGLGVYLIIKGSQKKKPLN